MSQNNPNGARRAIFISRFDSPVAAFTYGPNIRTPGIFRMRLTALLCCTLLASQALAATPKTQAAGNVGQGGFGPWGFDLAGMDRGVKAGDDFFAFANGTFVRNLVIPPDQARYGAFNILRDRSEARVHDILEQEARRVGANPADAIGKAGAFYKAYMDEKAVARAGLSPLGPDQERIRGLKTAQNFARLCGLAASSMLGSVFALDVQPDGKDPTRTVLYIGQAGLGLPDRDYYLSPAFAPKKALYPAFVERVLTLTHWPDAKAEAARVVAFENAVATLHWTRADRRDDDKTYNPVALADLPALAPGFDWPVFLAAAGIPADTKRVVLLEKSAIVAMAKLIGATEPATLRAWHAAHLAINAGGLLTPDLVNAEFEFFGRALQGQEQIRPRWKRAVHAAEGALGEAIGQAYVARFFPPESRTQMAALTRDLRDAFRVRLERNAWMTPATRKKALEKLGTFDFQIGFPKKWRDYGPLVVRTDDLYGNVTRAAEFEWKFRLSLLARPTDRNLWEMTPQTVNAYNNPLLNEVVFPAAILEPPFFNPKADPAINYGGIGGVIGHEMTHSFDDQGAKHDAQGRLNRWWTPEDEKKFKALSEKFGAQYARFEILPGARVNPALTMGENIADLGGLTLALDAYHASLKGKPAPVLDGLTGDQRVFLGWAQVWRSKTRDDAARQALTIDPHSPSVARVDGPTQNIDAWYRAFDVKPGEKHYLKPEERVKIW